MFHSLARTIIITGHYGSGKTNLSLNLALRLREAGEAVTLADLDIVNPYFRTADFAALAREKGISLVTPAFANSSVDLPALTGAFDAMLGADGRVIIDVGGDDDGAHALGRYAPRIAETPYSMLFVANFFRYLTRTPHEAAQYIREIEVAARLKVTHIVNNSNLAGLTTAGELRSSVGKARELSELTGIPLLGTAARRELVDEMAGEEELFSVDICVKTVWQ